MDKNDIRGIIHNYALDLKSGFISWEDFDNKVYKILDDISIGKIIMTWGVWKCNQLNN